MVIKRKSTINKANINRNLPQSRTLGYGKYYFPEAETVPPDYYYSKIVHIENKRTVSGKEAIAVYYIIAKFSDVYNNINNLCDKSKKINKLYIKQVYPLDSDAYEKFLEDMYDELGLDYSEEISHDMCIGLTEAYSICYRSPTGIGGITSRTYWDEDNFVELYKQEQERLSSAYAQELECDEYGNLI